MVTEGKAGSINPLDHESPSKIELKVVGAYPHHEEGKEVKEASERVIDGEGSVPKMKKKRIRLRQGVKIPKFGEITWVQMWDWTREFMKDPLNVAFVVWMVISTFFFAFICLSEIGALNSAFEGDDEKREEWTDIATQVMNALFVLMNLAFHPLFFHHSLYLWRWRLRDQLKLRSYYCRGGFQKPNDWWHILCVNIQAHIMCFSMYALALVYWIYPHGERPAAAVWTTMIIATISPVTAFLYFVMSPLQKDYNEVAGSSVGSDVPVVFHERNMVFALNGVVVENPEWQGSVCSDCFSKKKTAILTCLLPFVIFGMHMQRLNFGNKFIQASTFLLVVAGPLFLFELAAQTVKEHETRVLIAAMGLAVAELSFVYGAVWRTRMRKKYHLPASRWCFGNATMTDYAVWLLCPFCALCQEARTSQHYQIVEKTQEGLFVDPDDLAEGGADMDDSSSEFSFRLSNDNPMVPPEVMHDPVRGTPNKSGFTRLDKNSY